MGNIPVYGVSRLGIIKDVEPWDDPWEAWSGGNNVRFEDGKAQRAQINRTGPMIPATGSNLTGAAGVCSYRPYNGQDQTYLLDAYGRVNLATFPSTLTDATDTGFTPVLGGTQFTSDTLGNVFFINRETHAPRYLTAGASLFATIPNMDSAWTANILRVVGSFVVVLGVTKAGVSFPAMVKTSDATTAGAPPASWNASSTTTLAAETTLTAASGPITDAQKLRGGLAIYTASQIYQMQPTGDATFPFTYELKWEDDRWGSINRNCSIHVNGMNYVFGSGDLYSHDGVSPPVSIADGKVRKWVFANMNVSMSKRFFVAHDPYTSTIRFYFVSADGDANVKTPTGCNRVAAYSYKSATWGLEDAPNATGAAIANAQTLPTWTTSQALGTTWATSGASWADRVDGAKRGLIVSGTSGPGVLQSGLYVLDPITVNSRFALPADPLANFPSFLEHGGMSLSGNGLPLKEFKRVRAINPALRVTNGYTVQFSVGAAEVTQTLPNYGTAMSFDPTSNYHIDSRASGRFIAIRLDAPTLCEWDMTGFDADVVGGGKR